MTTQLSAHETARYDELTCALHRTDDPVAVLSRLGGLIADDVPACDVVTFVQHPAGRRPAYLAEGTPVTRAVNELQVRCQEGPLLDAVECDAPVISDDLGTDPRWPRIAAQLAGQVEVRSAWVKRLCGEAGVVLALYSSAPATFAGTAADDAARAAEWAHPVIDHFSSASRATNLSVALTTSRQIGAAMGVLMATRKVTEEQAFDLLRTASQQLHRKLREVAVEVTETGALPGWVPRPTRADGYRSRR